MNLKDRKKDARWKICKACKRIHNEYTDADFKTQVEEHILYLHKIIQSLEIQMGLRVVNDYQE